MIDYMQALKAFLDADGKLKANPVKQKKKLIALSYLATKFEHGIVYSEKEVNEIISQWHTFCDHATLRRELIDFKFLCRNKDCSAYFLPDILPDVEQLTQ